MAGMGGSTPGGTLGTARRSSGTRTAEARHTRWTGITTRTGARMGQWTCRVTYMSGYRTGTGRVITGMPRTGTRRVLRPAGGAWFAAARGAPTIPRGFVLPSGTGPAGTTGTSTWVFVAPRLLNYPLPFRPFTLRGKGKGVKSFVDRNETQLSSSAGIRGTPNSFLHMPPFVYFSTQ